MKVTGIKTHKITENDNDIYFVLDKYVTSVPEDSVLAITSKIVSICEGRTVAKVDKVEGVDKDVLVQQESEWYLPRSSSKYDVSLTITNGILAASAGIDESNGNGQYILWPEDVQKTANEIRAYLRKKFNIKNLGIIITDSKTTPLRWGVAAIAIAYSGFKPLKDYIGTKDIFGHQMEYTKMSIIDNLASAGALVMGEGNEQTPFAIIEDLPFVEFIDQDPTDEEFKNLKINLEDDLYAPLLQNVAWKKGEKKS